MVALSLPTSDTTWIFALSYVVRLYRRFQSVWTRSFLRDLKKPCVSYVSVVDSVAFWTHGLRHLLSLFLLSKCLSEAEKSWKTFFIPLSPSKRKKKKRKWMASVR